MDPGKSGATYLREEMDTPPLQSSDHLIPYKGKMIFQEPPLNNQETKILAREGCKCMGMVTPPKNDFIVFDLAKVICILRLTITNPSHL